MMRVSHKQFGGATPYWGELLNQAGEFATRVGRDRLISISQSHGPGMMGHVNVTVWYWEDDENAQPEEVA